MKKIVLLLLFFLRVTSFAAVSQKDLWSSLNPEQQAHLTKGKQVVITEKMPDSSWPAFHVYRLVHATPVQAAAVFWDVEYAPHFIPRCVKTKIQTCAAPNVMDVNYELQVPIFSNDISQVRNTLVAHPQKGNYEISWEVLHSTYSKGGKGSFVVIPHQEGALLCYSNFINPGSAISILRNQAQQQLQSTVEAMVAQIEHEIKSSPELLEKQIDQLKKASAKQN